MCSFRLCPPNQKVFPTPLIVYVVTFAQTHEVYVKAALRKGGSMEPMEPPLDSPLCGSS